jgi:hypothetical protein
MKNPLYTLSGIVSRTMSIIRRIALNLIKLYPDKKKSQRVKRKKAGWSDPFREALLRI